MFASVFSRIAAIFMVLLVGAWARWRKLLNQDTTTALSRIAIELALPFLYFFTLATGLNKSLTGSLIRFPLIAVFLTLSFFALSWLVASLLNIRAEKKRTFMFLASFSNYGFLAIPLVFALFGREGLINIFMFNLGISLMYWTLGVGILTGPRAGALKIARNLFNTAIAALVLGVVAGINSVPVPKFILEASELIGGSAIPLALIVVGSILAKRDTTAMPQLKIIAALIFCRLILMPALTLLFVKYFCSLPRMISVIIVLQAALPSASTTPILVKRFGGDEALAANGIFFTTLFSIVTVPLFLSLIL